MQGFQSGTICGSVDYPPWDISYKNRWRSGSRGTIAHHNAFEIMPLRPHAALHGEVLGKDLCARGHGILLHLQPLQTIDKIAGTNNDSRSGAAEYSWRFVVIVNPLFW